MFLIYPIGDGSVSHSLGSNSRGGTLTYINGGERSLLKESITDWFEFRNFDMHDWKDEGQARNLINQAKGIINANNATKENLRPIVGKLYRLLPMAPGKGGGPEEGSLVH